MRAGGAVPLARYEIWITWLLGALALAVVPVLRGQSSIIWDALNHHIYLGWIAERPRFDRDLLAAGWQSYQYPYLYWPAYKLAVSGASGVTAGVAFALLQSFAVPPMWLVAHSLCPGASATDIALRVTGVALGLAGALTLSLVDTTSNDMLAGIPLIWAIALGLMANAQDGVAERTRWRLVALSGLCAGISVAFKLSNGPLAVVMPFLWANLPGPLNVAVRRVVLGGLASLVGCALAYGPWGWAMWQQFGNPVYPFYDPAFDAVRAMLHWTRP